MLLRRGVRRVFVCSLFGGLVRFHLLRLRFLLGQLGSLEALAVKSDLRDANRRICLAMAAEFLVLLLALVVEYEDLRTPAFLHDFTNYAGVRLQADLAFFAGNRHHGELHLPVGAGAKFFHSNYISGRHPVLLSTGADDRIHTSASVKCRENS